MSEESEKSDKKEDMIVRYNKTSHFYDNRYKEIQNEKFNIILRKLDSKKPKILENKLILDGGAGTGLLFSYLQETVNKSSGLNYLYVATDLSLNMLKVFKKKVNEFLEATQARINLILSDLENLPLRDDRFDSIFLLTSIQNLPNQNIGLKESIRVGRSGASFNLSILKKKLNREKLITFLDGKIKDIDLIDKESIEDLIILGNIQ